MRSGRKAQWHTEIKSYPLRAHVLVEGADERLELGQGTGQVSAAGGRGEGNKVGGCVWGEGSKEGVLLLPQAGPKGLWWE